jgi:hypothetical protein
MDSEILAIKREMDQRVEIEVPNENANDVCSVKINKVTSDQDLLYKF